MVCRPALVLACLACAAAAAPRGLRGNGSAASPRALSDSRVSCSDTGRWDNINWCGGGGADWSCTPWNFRVDWTSDCETKQGCWTSLQCDGGDGDLIVGDDGNAATYIAKWKTAAGSWCDSRCGADPSYFVFHTCDGAGLQSDCEGSHWYVEQLSQWNVGNMGSPQPGEVHPTGSSQISFDFQHPGTGQHYDWYWCGWWSKTSGWSGWDPAAGWIVAAGLDPQEPTPSWARQAFGGQDAEATLALYPWICTVDGDVSKTGIQPGQAMYSGDHGGETWNCFCDNNGPSGSPGDSTPPPHFKMYSMRKEVDGEGNAYIRMIGVAGDAIDPGVSNDDFALYGFDDAW